MNVPSAIWAARQPCPTGLVRLSDADIEGTAGPSWRCATTGIGYAVARMNELLERFLTASSAEDQLTAIIEMTKGEDRSSASRKPASSGLVS